MVSVHMYMMIILAFVGWVLYNQNYSVESIYNDMNKLYTSKINTIFDNIAVLHVYNKEKYNAMKEQTDALMNSEADEKEEKYTTLRESVADFRLCLPDDEYILSTFDSNMSQLYDEINYSINTEK